MSLRLPCISQTIHCSASEEAVNVQWNIMKYPSRVLWQDIWCFSILNHHKVYSHGHHSQRQGSNISKTCCTLPSSASTDSQRGTLNWKLGSKHLFNIRVDDTYSGIDRQKNSFDCKRVTLLQVKEIIRNSGSPIYILSSIRMKLFFWFYKHLHVGCTMHNEECHLVFVCFIKN